MIQLAEREDSKSSRERADLMRALSFDAVQGLGRKVQEEHMKRLGAVKDEFSKRWIKNGRRLTDQDYLDLNRAKTDIDQSIAQMKFNVSLYWKTANDIKQNPDLYHYSTVENLKKYMDEGDVGRNLDDVIRYMPDMNKYLWESFGNLRSTSQQKKLTGTDMERGVDIYTYSNKDEISTQVRSGLENNAYYQSLKQSDDPYVREQADKAVENFINQISTTRPHEATLTDSRRKEISRQQMSPYYKRLATKYGFTNMSQGEIANAVYFNDFAKRLLGHDEDALELLAKKRGFKNYEVKASGDVVFYDKKGVEVGSIPALESDDPDIVRQAMTAALDLVPHTMEGKQKPTNIQNIIRTSWGETKVKNVAEITVLKELKDALSKKGNEREDYGPSARDDMAVLIEELLPDSKVGSKFSTGGNRNLEIDDETFNLAKPSERKRMINHIGQEMGNESAAIIDEEPEGGEEPAGDLGYTIEIGAQDSIASRNNNPGNLEYIGQPEAEKGEARKNPDGSVMKRDGETVHWAKFESPEEGFEAVVQDIEAKQKGKTSTDLDGNSSIADFIKIYAAENKEKTERYLKFLEDNFGIKPGDKLKDVDARHLATAVVGQESSTKISAGEPEETASEAQLSKGSLDDL